jgi:hypothetical protein
VPTSSLPIKARVAGGNHERRSRAPSTGGVVDLISVGVSTFVVATVVSFTTMFIAVSVPPSARKSKPSPPIAESQWHPSERSGSPCQDYSDRFGVSRLPAGLRGKIGT